MPVDWVVFDVGNTLLGLDYERLTTALAGEGFSTTGEALRRAEIGQRPALEASILGRWHSGDVPPTGWIEAQVWVTFWREVLLAAGACSTRCASLVQITLNVTRPATNWSNVTPGAAATLSALAPMGIRMGVISNSDGSVEEQLRSLGLDQHFEFVLDSARVGVEKPHPAIFKQALERAGVTDPSRAVYVGDVYAIDVLGAARAGLRPVLYDPGWIWTQESLPNDGPACEIVRSLGEIEVLVRELART